MTKGKITEQYAITAVQLMEFVKIAEKLRKIIAKNQEKKKLYRDASSIRYGELK